ncbi:MAG: hypothetical protein ABIR83_12030 [Nakamurella sp.]
MGSPASEATTPQSTTATPVGSTGSGSADPADLELAAELFDLAGVDVVPGVKVEARRVAVTSAAATDWATGFGYAPTQATVTGTSIVVTVLLNRERQCWIGKESPGVSATLFEAGCGPKLMALFVFP